MSEANKALAARVALEVFGQGKFEVVDEVIAPEFIDHGRQRLGAPRGPEGVKIFAAAIRRAFPDLSVRIDHSVAEGDLVAMLVTSWGTTRDEFAGLPPTGRQARWEALHIQRLRDGKIVEHWVLQGQVGMYEQFGHMRTSKAEQVPS